jgi:glycosyltransferase involved in cell wall biosynthesis
VNIGLDARSLFSPRPRGTGRNLHDAYRALAKLRPDWHFTLYHQRPARSGPRVAARPDTAGGRAAEPWPENVALRPLFMPGDRIGGWFQLRLPAAAWMDGIDVLHLPASVAPAWCRVPMVVTVHDLVPLNLEAEVAPAARARFQRGLARAARGAARIVTASRAACADLCAAFPRVRGRVAIIPWAPDAKIRAAGSDAAPERLRSHYDLARPWLLNFSGNTRRKNAPGLIAAYALLPRGLAERHLLVLVGCSAPRVRAELRALAECLGVAEHCRVLPFVPHEDLPGLLRGARALLIPSLYEGFGLPVLDALACGVPVLAANTSSLPEVAGDAAVYCDPHRPASIAAGIQQVLRPDVAAALIQRGRRRVAAFTWERTAGALAAVFEQAAAARPSRALRVHEASPCP